MICNPPTFHLLRLHPPAFSGPLKKIVLHFTTHSYASALIRLWGETFISPSFSTQSITEQLYYSQLSAYHILSNMNFIY
jgi:hypothetical protein